MPDGETTAIFLNCLTEIAGLTLPGPSHTRSPEERFDPRREAFGCFLDEHRGKGVFLFGIGRADFLTTGPEMRLVGDHLNLTGNNPLLRTADEKKPPRFPSQDSVWLLPPDWLDEAVCTAAMAHPLQFTTPAEREFLHRSGAGAVTGDLVFEAILANFLGIPSVGMLLSRDAELDTKRVRGLVDGILAGLGRLGSR